MKMSPFAINLNSCLKVEETGKTEEKKKKVDKNRKFVKEEKNGAESCLEQKKKGKKEKSLKTASKEIVENSDEKSLAEKSPRKKRKRDENFEEKKKKQKKTKDSSLVEKSCKKSSVLISSPDVHKPKGKNDSSSNWKRLSCLLEGEKSQPKKVSSPIQKSNISLDKSEELWFDDVDPIYLTSQTDQNPASKKPPLNFITGSFSGPTKYLAMDCEMVGVGPKGCRSVLARCSIVNVHGRVVYDKYVKPTEKITDYRTFVSGITKKHLINAIPFDQAQREVSSLIKDRIVVGHALHNDFQALLLSHPKHLIRDTSHHKYYRKLNNGKTPSLKKLAKSIFGLDIQHASHCSVEDARVTLHLFKHRKSEWEKELAMNPSTPKSKPKKKPFIRVTV
eukprot:Sdes_comp9643_c0_seq2m1136